MTQAAAASKYEIMSISSERGKVFIGGKVVAFDYFESIMSPNITANVIVVDSGGSITYDKKYDTQERSGSIYNALPITGREKVEFRIKSALGTLDFEKRPLFVNGVSNPDQNSQRESILLSLFSEGAKLNSEATVVRKYSGNIGQSVTNILNEFLIQKVDPAQSESVRLNPGGIQPTANNYNFVGNSKSAFENICNLGSKSVSQKDSAGFFFFETQDGFNFKSIDRLIATKPKARYYKGEGLVGTVSNYRDNFKILSCVIRKNQNVLNALNQGVYYSRNIYFNPKTFKETEVIYRFTEGKLVKSLGKSAEAPDINAYTKTNYNVLDIGTLEQTVAGDDNNDPKDYRAQAEMRYNILFSQLIDIQVPCNPNLRAGDTIHCDFEIITQSKKVQGFEDPVQSGKYLIVDLCHHYEPTRSITSLTLARDSYGLYTTKNES